MPDMMKTWLVLGFLAAALSGCGLPGAATYATPEVTLPAGWQHPPEAASRLATPGQWPAAFGEPELDRLVGEVLKRNNDLAAAAFKVRQARLKAGLKADALIPAASAGGSAGYSHDLRARQADQSYAASGSLAYELDLWGKLAAQRDLATWEAQATEEDRQSTALTLVATTVDLYFQIAYLNERLALGEEGVALAQRTLELAKVRHGTGAESSLEEYTAQSSLASQQAGQEDLKRQLALARTALAVLLDAPPGDAATNPARLPQGQLPPVDAGLPAEILGRRPDLRAAELRLRQSLGNVDLTRVSYYPTLKLTGELGTTSGALLKALDNPVASLLASVTLPFVQRTEMRLNVELARAQYDQAVVEFRQTLYEALKEVEDALAKRQYYATQGVRLGQARDAARAAERLYENRYRSGAVALQSWLDAQETRRQAEISLLANRYDRLASHVTLCQALGGAATRPDLDS